MPESTEESSSIPQIAIWGATNVGKTVYLAGAMLALDTFYPEEWTWDKGGESADRDKTSEFIRYQIAKLQRGSLLLGATPPGKPDRFVFQLEQQGNRWGTKGRYHEIALIDIAGVAIEDSSDRHKYFETLRSSQGILMLIDPNLKNEYEAAAPEISKEEFSYYQLIDLLAEHLQTAHALGPPLTIPVAICLTKIDQEEHWRHHDEPRKYLENTLGKAPFNRLNKIFRKKEFFAVSVAGRCKDKRQPGKEISNMDLQTGCLINPKQWQPYKVLDPLFWLLDELEAERDQRLSWGRRALRRMVRERNYKK